MQTGKVKFYNRKKGFGFIETEAGTELYVHGSVVSSNKLNTLEVNDIVLFNVESDVKGPKAVNVILV